MELPRGEIPNASKAQIILICGVDDKSDGRDCVGSNRKNGVEHGGRKRTNTDFFGGGGSAIEFSVRKSAPDRRKFIGPSLKRYGGSKNDSADQGHRCRSERK